MVSADIFPDPFAPLLPPDNPAQDRQARSLRQQRVRRAKILAATRRLLASESHNRLTLRRVADECDVAVQTIRNSFGRREELIVSAVNEHTTAIWQSLGRTLPAREAIIEFAGMIHSCAVETPGFLRGTLALAFSRNPSLLALQSHAAAHKLHLLRRLAAEEALCPDVELDMLADQITRLDTILMYEWAQTGDSSTLKAYMATSHDTLLRGALHRSQVAAVTC